ncbi:TRAP transporter substrate-binding protein [Roseibium aggregatum]|uniref:TRAP transporter substrate-binding protein n=1 Tax=Roseibium aggregatum TaxID=187304 RepID=A0A939EHC8_9HYPH|nr:TRAP transporter substrate-binding protein [Roseibium aggregatum]MBN9672993.1 TRAP transporter substrate-binding protein [Roseibium aggregatum]
MFINRVVTACAALALGGVMAMSCAAAEQTTLRFAMPVPSGQWILQNDLLPWAEKIEKESGGRIVVDIQPVGVFGTPDTYLELVESGVIDGAWFVPGYAPGRFRLTSSVELPGIFKTAEQASSTYWKLFEEGLLGGEYYGVKPLALFMNVPYIMMTKDHRIETMSDLKGLKLRASGRMIGSVLEAIGASGVGMPASEMAEAIRLGVLNGTVFAYEALEPFGIADLITDINETPLGSITHIVIMNPDSYDKLPDDLKKVIDDNSGLAFSEQLGASYDEADKRIRAKYDEKGTYTVTVPSEAFLAEYKSAITPVFEAWKEEARAADGNPDAILARIEELTAQ